jgi:hypothetical protein
MNTLGAISITTFIVYTLAWSAGWWFMTRERPAPRPKYHANPIEITTPEERARGERTFEMARERTWGVTRGGFYTLITVGYFVLTVIFVIEWGSEQLILYEISCSDPHLAH